MPGTQATSSTLSSSPRPSGISGSMKFGNHCDDLVPLGADGVALRLERAGASPQLLAVRARGRVGVAAADVGDLLLLGVEAVDLGLQARRRSSSSSQRSTSAFAGSTLRRRTISLRRSGLARACRGSSMVFRLALCRRCCCGGAGVRPADRLEGQRQHVRRERYVFAIDGGRAAAQVSASSQRIGYSGS